jgi:hypothetical protein
MTTRAVPRTYTFTVRGQGLFPFDMLRYDRCTPKTENDSAIIEHTTRPARKPDDRLPKRITLVGPKAPTDGRWASFGWEVESVE